MALTRPLDPSGGLRLWAENAANFKELMVDATGIEPVTPSV